MLQIWLKYKNIPVILCFAFQRELVILRESRVSFPVTQLNPEFVGLLTCQSGNKFIS